MLKIFYTDHYVLPLPDGHRFPMEKYSLLRERVAGSPLGAGLMDPRAATDEEILRAHEAGYVARVVTGTLAPDEVRRIGFPWSPAMVERSRRSSGATLEACRAALADGVRVNLAGGTHHAFRDRGEGYCVFNDSAIAALAHAGGGRARRVVVIDCDVHQGNGTAAILADDPSVFTFSIHGANNFPFAKETSDLDVELPDGTGDDDYLEALRARSSPARWPRSRRPRRSIWPALTRSRTIASVGSTLSKGGLRQRDRLVLRALPAGGVPVAVTMAGGYARRIEDTVDIHFATVEIAADLDR